ncbi:MAG TPA: hypothetical protein VFM14_05695, partial [Gemmatimonadales bacterium]|nr:hypothetical protein [Gemmatimonadales bacterium]
MRNLFRTRLSRAALVFATGSVTFAATYPEARESATSRAPGAPLAVPPILQGAGRTPGPAPDRTAAQPGTGASTVVASGVIASGPVAPLRRGTTPAAWPVGPEPRQGAVLPGKRIVAYYGNPLSKRMGVLGELAADSMMASLRQRASEWQAADSTRGVQPALHLIATVAQGYPGRDRKHRLRMADTLIERVAGWAEANGWLLFLDVQVGHSSMEAELPRLAPWLARPYVHLGLDPEFAMKDGSVPGRKIGTIDAREVNYAIDLLGGIVDSLGLPPKVLVVHRFTQRMLTGYDRIELDPRVQVVIHMDGFGDRPLKRSVYRDFIVKEPVQFTGFKLFYKNDRPMMT